MASTVDELDLYEKYLALSDKLRIADEDKTKWVCDKVATALAARDKQIELEKEKRDKEIELEKERREHELKILTLKQTVSHTDNAESAGLSEKPSKKPRFPMFNALIQDIDVYLDNFSRHATASKWPQREWPSILFNLLQGEALTVLLSLSDADRECYEKVRDALLRYGNCTISGFNKKFRSSAPLESENFETFVNRVKRYFDRWIGLANVSTFEQLVFLMLKEQIYSSCSDELATYLKDRKPTSLEHMKDLANAFTEARPHVHLSMKKPTLGDTFTSAVGVARSSRPLQKNSDNSRSASNSRANVQCYRCGKYGHIKKQCRVPEHALKPPATKPRREQSASNVSRSNRNSARESNFQNKQGSPREFSNVAVASAFDAGEDTVTLTQSADAAYFVDGVQFSCVASQPSVVATGNLQFWEAKVNGKCATLLRDSGCTTVGVRKSFVKQEDYTGKRIKCVTFGGTVEEFPTARINLDSEFYSGTIVAAVLPNPVADIILGNIEGTVKGDLLTQTTCPVTTRAQSLNQTKALQNPASVFSLPEGDLGRLQANDESLKGWLGKVGLEQKGPITFIKENGVLFRIYTDRQGSAHKTLAAPNAIRNKLLWAAHDCPLSGHHGVSKTLKNILSEFSWPGVSRDVVTYVKSCHICQVKAPINRDKKAPLQPMPLMEEPFQRVVVDLVGPLEMSEGGNSYILTLVDLATRWAEATPLRHVTSEHVAEALYGMFCRLGFPVEIQSDRGPQFISALMAEFDRFSGMKHIFSSPYRPQTNGSVERFHSSLKSILRKVTSDFPKQWDRYLPSALFAYRQMEHESTGFSPFFLLFGRKPRGPMALIADSLLTSTMAKPEFSYRYIHELHQCAREACHTARDALRLVQQKSRDRQLPRSALKVFKTNDPVLVLLPDANNKLLMRLRGPFKIIDRISSVNYRVQIDNRIVTLHVNLLRRYYPREVDNLESSTSEPKEALTFAAMSALIEEEDTTWVKPTVYTGPELNGQVDINPALSKERKKEVLSILKEFPDVLTSKPGCTPTLEHSIKLKTEEPIFVKQYPLPFSAKKVIEEEVRSMLDLGVIEPSTSPYCSPVVLVKKKDGSVRFCIDFRKLNAATVLDATNIPNPEDLFVELRGSRMFTSCDLAKAYWQVPLDEASRPFTAFQTPMGLMQWVRMPFGLVTAPATFNRLMRLVFAVHADVVSYFDDAVLHSPQWDNHMMGLRNMLMTLRQHKLTANPAKLHIAYDTIDFLGHCITEGTVSPQPGKIHKILNLETPKTKKQIKSLVGLVSFYRAFIPSFSDLTAPLTNLLKAGCPEKVVWNSQCETSFARIQELLASYPILRLPDFTKEFVVRTDASDVGIGAVLLQAHNDTLMPCKYASRKLLPRETRYSTIEREALGVIFAVSIFSRYLRMSHFILEVDHRPLLFLKQRKAKNARLTRWALALQEFSFTVRAIAGVTNHHADVMSRLG